MSKIAKLLDDFKKNEKKELINTIIITFIVGLLAHMYCFANLSLSHDALNEFYLYGPVNYEPYLVYEHKMALGRFFSPLYLILFRGKVVVPWLSGVLSLIWASLAVYITCKLFDLKKTIEIVLVSGIFVTNLSFIAEAGAFLHDLDSYMFAAALSILSVYFWDKGKKYYVFSIICILIAMGIYQSMLSVTITMIIFLSIKKLLHNTGYKKVLLDGIISLIILAISGVLYLCAVRIINSIFSLQLTTGYNSLSNLWDKQEVSKKLLLLNTYRVYFDTLLNQQSIQSVLTSSIIQYSLLILLFAEILYVIFRCNTSFINKLLFALLLVATPVGMNLSYFLNNGITHTLMLYAVWLTYLLILLLAKCCCEVSVLKKIDFISSTKLFQILSVFVLSIMIWSNIKTANAAYIKKDLEFNQTLSLMTRVAERLETTPEYKAGETPVAFIGRLDFQKMECFGNVYDINGQRYVSTISSENFIACYFEYILNRPIVVKSWDERNKIALLEQVQNMPVYPDEMSIQWIDDYLVVKMNPVYY